MTNIYKLEEDFSFEMLQGDDFHVHLRDGIFMEKVVDYTARQFKRALIMPNLNPAISNVDMALAYKNRIKKAVKFKDFEPLMSLYLNEQLDEKEIKKAQANDIKAIKLYPQGVTFNSKQGITDIEKIYPILEIMQKYGLILLIHGESNHPLVDVFDKEAVFIDTVLSKLIKHFPELKIVLEHISTKEAVNFLFENNSKYLAATITAHHLLCNRNSIFNGGLNPHYYCLPILKREEHRLALLKAATSGQDKFFLGTDSAPHAVDAKVNACGCAGCFTAYNALELYLTAFASVNKIENFEKFASINGAKFYNLPANTNKVKITYTKEPFNQIPTELDYGPEKTLVPFWSTQNLHFKVEYS